MFYKFIVGVYKETQEINNIGQCLSSYTYNYDIKCDVQPSSEQLLYKTFGKDVESNLIIYCDEDIEVGTIVKFNNNFYMINNKIDWIDYRIYSIVDCEVDIDEH